MNLAPLEGPDALSGARKVLTVALAAMLLTLGVLGTGTAAANAPIKSVETGSTDTQAGAHPDILVSVKMTTRAQLGDYGPGACYCETVRNLTVRTPQGVVGSPLNLPRCKPSEFALGSCPVESQVGVAFVDLGAPPGVSEWMPLYNMEPNEDQLALLATPAPFLQSPIYLVVSARTESDYGLEFEMSGVPNLIDIGQLGVVTWGVPAAHSHDDLRFAFGGGLSSKFIGCGAVDPAPLLFRGEYPCGTPPPPVTATSAEQPFISNPAACVGPLSITAETVAYDGLSDSRQAPYPASTACDQLTFNPSLSAKPTTDQADSPSGLNIDLRAPQFLSPTTPSPSEIRATKVTLPPGLTVSPAAADGKLSCTDAEARFGTREAAQCPAFSKIGTLSVESSSFPGDLPGSIYLGEPQPGNRYRLFLVADGFSLHIKLPGSARLDPVTGQVTVTFNDLPEAPFQDFNFHLFGAERGLLTTPTQCGTYPVESEFTPWATGLPNQTSTQFFTIDSGPAGGPCPPSVRAFAPRLSAGVTDATGGAHTTFSLDLARADGDQNLKAVNITTPRGFSGTLAGIPYCPDSSLAAVASPARLGQAELQTSICPAASQVGTASASAGAGSRPVTLPGKVYLAGPYQGAPLSLAVVTPAVSGPYDLGNVVVRVGLKVDPRSAQITAVSDPLPEIVDGIPLRLRQVMVNLDRPNFALNPTNCSAYSIAAEVFGNQGALSRLSQPFQVADCRDLDFRPQLGLKLRGSTRHNGHPALTATLTAKPQESNIKTAVVTMPHSLFLEIAHVKAPCTRVQYAAGACPSSSVLGRARVQSPLFDQPLEGPLYLRVNPDHTLPDLVAALRGQVDVEVVGRVDSVGGRLRTSFESLPDAPISKFTLQLAGKRKGLLVNSEGLCTKPQRAQVRMVGQNGAATSSAVRIQLPCARRDKHRRQSHKGVGR